MKIVMLTDLHGRINIIPGLVEDLQSSDLIILAGDITHFGNSAQLKKMLGLIMKFQPNIMAVSGNCDPGEIEDYIDRENISLHLKSKIHDNICFVGLSGSLPCPGTTPNEYSEAEFSGFLDKIKASADISLPMVLVSHQPPYNCKNDLLPTGIHVGCQAIRKFIETESPIVCLCGHIHEGIGIDKIGKTIIINPGPFREGHYALINILPDVIEAELITISV
jgi:uncharacterized protein